MVLDVAVKTWLAVGAVAAEVSTEVVADLRAFDTPAIRPVAVPVIFVPTSAVGVPSAGVTNVGDVARTTGPVPVFAVAATPLIEKLFPVPAVSKVLFVNVSVVALPTRVSVAAGKVSVPLATAVGWMVVDPLVDPGSVIDAPVPPVTYSGVTALAFVPSQRKSWREQVLNVLPIVPAPRTLVGHTKVWLPVPSWQMLNQMSCPAVALPVERVEDVTLPVRVMKKPWMPDADTVKVGVAEYVVVV